MKFKEIFIFHLLFFFSYHFAISASSQVQLLGCGQKQSIARVTVKNKINPQDLKKTNQDEALLLKLSTEQLKFFYGVFHFGLKSVEEFYSIIPKSQDLEISKEGKVFYYKATFLADYCGPKSSSLSFDVALPGTLTSPLKFMKRSSYRKIRFNNIVKKIFPCTDEEYINLNLDDLWYTWNPFKTGVDADNKPFSCSEILKNFPSAHVKIEFEPTKITTKKIKKYVPSDVAIIFGKISPLANDKDVKNYLNSFITSVEKGQSPPVIDENFDLHALSYFLSSLSERYRITKASMIDESFVSMNVLINQRKVTIKLLSSDTELNLSSLDYEKKLLSLLQNSDVFIYIGHSGFGKNLNINELGKVLKVSEAKLKEKMRTKNNQVIGINSCFASSHFGDDVTKLREGLTTDFYLSMNSRYLPNFPLFMIERSVEKSGEDFYPKDWMGKFYLKRIYHE